MLIKACSLKPELCIEKACYSYSARGRTPFLGPIHIVGATKPLWQVPAAICVFVEVIDALSLAVSLLGIRLATYNAVCDSIVFAVSHFAGISNRVASWCSFVCTQYVSSVDITLLETPWTSKLGRLASVSLNDEFCGTSTSSPHSIPRQYLKATTR